MRKLLAVCAVAGLIVAVAGTAGAVIVQTDLDYTVTLSGSWTTQWQYANTENWVDTCVGGVWETDHQVGAGASTTYGSASSSSGIVGTTLTQSDTAKVWGMTTYPDYGWALAYSDSGANWLTAGGGSPVTVTITYNYTLDGSLAAVEWESKVNMYIQLWGGTGNAERLYEQGAWTRRASDGILKFTDSISGGPPDYKQVSNGTASWTFTPEAGKFYSIWAGGDAYAWDVVPEPLTMLGMFLGLGSVGAYIRKRWMR